MEVKVKWDNPIVALQTGKENKNGAEGNSDAIGWHTHKSRCR